ncbi:uncharacterized protein LOC127765120 [Oryza glaberrima]|uniref:uncharacterized protein LOC127765120 n=1 Tax=Oryza glaberrima TaxID=4538 RepID=UPI00224C55C0|nr:uncharacterized protein LOC127765120 [Oryza glaberrima]
MAMGGEAHVVVLGGSCQQDEATESSPPSLFQLPHEFMLSPIAALSLAARYAAIERSVRPLPPTAPSSHYYAAGDDPILLDVDGDGNAAFVAVLGPTRPSILSPVPSALPPMASLPSRLFSPLDQASVSWLSGLSPFVHSAGATPPPQPMPSFALARIAYCCPRPPSPMTFSIKEFFSSNFPDLSKCCLNFVQSLP